VAPPRRRNHRRRARVVGPRGPVSVPEPDPEPSPPPRRGLLATLLGPSPAARPSSASALPPRRGLMASLLGGPPAPRSAPPLIEGPPWARADYYILAGITAAIIVVIGLLLGGTSAAVNASVQSKPTTPTSFTVTQGDGPGFAPGQAITVGGEQSTVKSVLCDRITLATPLARAPAAGAPVSQESLFPFMPTDTSVVAQVASKPAPSAKTFTLTCDGSDLNQGETLTIGGEAGVISSVSGNAVTLSSPLRSAPAPGTTVKGPTGPFPGALLAAVANFLTGELAIIILPIAALLARPMVSRLVRKPRPRAMETIFFGAAIWVIDTLVIQVLFSLLPISTLGAWLLAVLVGMASGFVIIPAVFPFLSRLLRPRPRVQASGARR
jgi:hypothetical protein